MREQTLEKRERPTTYNSMSEKGEQSKIKAIQILVEIMIWKKYKLNHQDSKD